MFTALCPEMWREGRLRGQCSELGPGHSSCPESLAGTFSGPGTTLSELEDRERN